MHKFNADIAGHWLSVKLTAHSPSRPSIKHVDLLQRVYGVQMARKMITHVLIKANMNEQSQNRLHAIPRDNIDDDRFCLAL